MKTIEVEGSAVKFKKIRTSAKGVPVYGARIHLAGIGTAYIQVYEEQVRAIAAHANPRPEPLPKPLPPPRASDVRNMLFALQNAQEQLKALGVKGLPKDWHKSIPPPPPSV